MTYVQGSVRYISIGGKLEYMYPVVVGHLAGRAAATRDATAQRSVARGCPRCHRCLMLTTEACCRPMWRSNARE
eukprot:5077074-Pleurochrysis_carterae.AAC.2